MKKTKSLNDLAVKYRDSALNAINPGVPYAQYQSAKNVKSRGSSKAYKYGNLQARVGKYNTPQSMVKPFGEDGFQIVLNVAPGGAEYGSYVHYGKYKRGVMKPRPFGELALENPEFIQLYEKIMGEKMEDKVVEYMDNIDDEFTKAGFTVS